MYLDSLYRIPNKLLSSFILVMNFFKASYSIRNDMTVWILVYMGNSWRFAQVGGMRVTYIFITGSVHVCLIVITELMST